MRSLSQTTLGHVNVLANANTFNVVQGLLGLRRNAYGGYPSGD